MRVEEPREKYLDQIFGLPDADLALVRARMLRTGWEAMSISSAEARILQFLIRGFGVRDQPGEQQRLGYDAAPVRGPKPPVGPTEQAAV